MDVTLLRMRMVSFKDEKRQSLNDTLFYIKKLTEIQPNPGFFHLSLFIFSLIRTSIDLESPTILEQNQRSSSIVLSCNETFDWHIDEGNYCQILFLSPEFEAKPRGDIILWFNHLTKMLQDRRYLEQTETELNCDVRIFFFLVEEEKRKRISSFF